MVCYGFLGAATDSEKSKLTEKLLDSVLCEWAAVETSMLTPLEVPCLLKGMMAGHWFDLQASWSIAACVWC